MAVNVFVCAINIPVMWNEKKEGERSSEFLFILLIRYFFFVFVSFSLSLSLRHSSIQLVY